MSDDKWRIRALSAAVTRLTHEFWDRYTELYAEEREAGTAKRPQSRAKTRLSHEQPTRYRELYVEECNRFAQLPEPERRSPHRRGASWRS